MTSQDGERVKCRPITKDDFGAVSDLLGRGFPHRGSSYFLKGLERVAARGDAQNARGFGFLLEQGGRIAGSLIQIYSDRPGFPGPRCNPCSWYVEPQARSFATMLTSMALKDKSVTYVNVTPAPSTWPILEVQGYTKYCGGGMLAFPLVNVVSGDMHVERVLADRAFADGLPAIETQMLRDAAALGCHCYVVRHAGATMPFAFLPMRAKSGRLRLPVAQLVYCRETADFVTCAGVLGRALLRRGLGAVWLDADGKIPGLRGWFTDRRGRKYRKGPGHVRHNDLLDTELTLFGP